MQSISFSPLSFPHLSSSLPALGPAAAKTLSIVYIFGLIGSAFAGITANQSPSKAKMPVDDQSIGSMNLQNQFEGYHPSSDIIWKTGLSTATNPWTDETMKCLTLEIDHHEVNVPISLKATLEKIVDCKASLSLLRNVVKDGDLLLVKGDDETAPAGGAWAPKERAITLNMKENPNRKIGHLLFELANAMQNNEQTKLIKESDLGLVSKEKYVKRWEEIEYKTAQLFSSIVQQCITTDKWPKATDMDIPLVATLSWDQYWPLIKGSNHANLFRENWNLIVKEAYCTKNPKAAECKN
jgi:hypothetical protein